jgi:ubiquinone/menaquinone biosynthesis C-methylase UbiE
LRFVNSEELEKKVKEMYRDVALNPEGRFHFEMGRGLAERLGYPVEDLNRIPSEAVDSFAGVGYHFDLASIRTGEKALDLGSGSGMDTFVSALHVGMNGEITGVDMTDEQLEKAERLRRSAEFNNMMFKKGHIESLPLGDASFDLVMSNGVVNLTADKEKTFKEAARVLKQGGRLAISDIVTEKPLTQEIVCDVNLWASCIGGAMQQDDYRKVIESAGMQVIKIKENPQYGFLSESAQWATGEFGVKSVSILAKKLA